MPTDKLGLPTINGNMTSDVVRDLNALAQAVDDKVGIPDGLARLGPNGKLLPNQENEVTIADASTINKGVVQLDDSVDSTSTTKAATANAVNKVKKLFSNVANFAVATVAEAKAGLVNNKYMTPLRVSEAISSLAPRNVPNGYAGTDENGKIIDAVIPSSIENYVRIALLDFLANPTSLASVSGLSEYKKILIRLMQTKTNTTSSVIVQITYNRQLGNSMYTGSSTAGLINATSVNVPVTSTYPIANGDIEIDNQNLYYRTETKTYNETLDGISGSHTLGTVSLRNRLSSPLDVLEFMVSGSGNSFIGGKIEVLGVRR